MKRIQALLMALVAIGVLLPASALAQPTLKFTGEKGPGVGLNIVLIAGDEEYRSEESAPMLAKILSERHGFTCTVLSSLDKTGKYIDPNNSFSMPKISQLAKADLMIIGTRFRKLKNEEYNYIADYLNAGRPVIGFRTATHAFTGGGKTGDFAWSQFGLKILGERWINHHGRHKVQGTRGVINETHAKHNVLNGVKDVFGPSDVYGVRHVNRDNATILLFGGVTKTLDPKSEIIDDPKNMPMMPIAWLREYTAPNGKSKGKAFCTTMGSSTDFANEDLRRLVVNASYHLVGLKVPAKANVDFVDGFNPTPYGFIREKDYFKNRKLTPYDFALGKTASTGLPGQKVAKKKPAPKKRKPAPKKKKDPKEGLPKFPNPPKAAKKPGPVKLPISLKKNESIAFVGNMLGERMLYTGYFESAIHRHYPNHEISVRNMCNPGDTPGFRPNSSRFDPWAFPGAEKFNQDKKTHYGIGHYPSQDEWLFELKADTIFGFFGYNESFDGAKGVANFKAELAAWIDHSHSVAYNGKTAPRIVLVTPIAFEDRRDAYDLPDGSAENKNLALYSKAMVEVAQAKKVGAVDLFSLTSKWFSQKGSKLTINGCHLNDAGYKKLSVPLYDAIFGKDKSSSPAEKEDVRKMVLEKDYFWFNDYRMLNGVHVYGRRWKPYGNVNYPEEIEKMRQMTKVRDKAVWTIAAGQTPDIDDGKTRSLSKIETNFKRPIEYLGREKALEKFAVMDGYEIELFASEREFPDLRNPVQMSFDNQGRLWVAVIPSYPHYKPGGELPNDKLIILEDTNGDGRADKQSVFADGLNLPIGFEIAPEGVYVSQEPHLCLLVDDDKDGRADRLERILTGFDSHDTHHAISAYCADPSGAFYLCEGRFLHSQVETPYGPQRMTDGGVWRFDPASYKLIRYSQADYSNPWGITFDHWEQCYISDASSGQNWWGLPVSAKIPHGLEIPKVDQFAPKRARPTSGTEFVSTRHFPEDVQGHFMICNSIGFLGTSFHDVYDDGSGIYGKHVGDLVSSSDPNFRPVDIETAPDGSVYFIDWHNALIGHMQHNARDPNRDHDHGRVYRITAKGRDLVKPAKVAGATIPKLLENLKLPEYRTRYRTRRELRSHPANKVIPAVRKWANNLDKKDPNYEHYLCEALWATWAQNKPNRGLLQKCLNANAFQARAAAVSVLRYSHRHISDSTRLFMQAANDAHGRVRLEAIIAASWLDDEDGARIALQAIRYPLDKWMGPVTEMILKTTLKDDIAKLQASKDVVLNDHQIAADFLAGKLKLSKFVDPEKKSYGPTTKLSAAQMEEYKLGKEVFGRDAHCATCHQHNGQGVPNIYPPLIAKDNPWLSDSDERLIKVVLKGLWGPMQLRGQTFDPSKGVPPMPGFAGLLKDDEIAAAINYARNSFGNKAKFITAAQVAKVRQQTASRSEFYLIEDIMKEHPIKGWEQWQKAAAPVQSFE